jgi:5-(carboxyamino)imidazole ribonucleotide mutase
MPAGIAVGTLAIGKAGAANAAWLALSISALSDPQLDAALKQERKNMADKVMAKSEAAQQQLDALTR